MERSSTVVAGKTTTVTVSLSQNNNIYLRQGIINTSEQQQRTTTTTTTTILDDSAEISIFEAEKYFNELNALDASPKLINTPTNNHKISPATETVPRPNVDHNRFSSASSSTMDGYSSSICRNYRTRSFRSAATPTASSEASWNSQTGLLSVQPGSMSVSLRNTLASGRGTSSSSSSSSPMNPAASSTFSWLSLRKNCPCSCKKSVEVKAKPSRPQIPILPPLPPQRPQQQQQQSHMTVRTTCANSSKINSNNTMISMDKVRHDSFQESWYQSSRRSASNPRGGDNTNTNANRLLSSASVGIGTAKTTTCFGGNNNNSNSNININTGGSTAPAFSFPILNVNTAIKLKDENNNCNNQDPGRHSLEVFRPSHEKPSTLVIRASDRPFGFPASPNSRVKACGPDVIDDGASDASSDLFEIESLSTQTTATTATTSAMARASGPASVFMYRREASRQQQESLEEPMTPTTECCYEPSEASIDWSVTTAEGFDRASVAYAASEADYGEFSEPAVERIRRRSSSGGLLMSCRCEKAVSVGRPVPRLKPSVGVGVGPGVSGGYYAGEHGRQVGPGMGLSSSSTLAMWAVGHKL